MVRLELMDGDGKNGTEEKSIKHSLRVCTEKYSIRLCSTNLPEVFKIE